MCAPGGRLPPGSLRTNFLIAAWSAARSESVRLVLPGSRDRMAMARS
jgi:hypothetical protein